MRLIWRLFSRGNEGALLRTECPASVRSGLVSCDPLVNQLFEQVERDGAVFENDGVEVL